jgi:universal stress protein E
VGLFREAAQRAKATLGARLAFGNDPMIDSQIAHSENEATSVADVRSTVKQRTVVNSFRSALNRSVLGATVMVQFRNILVGVDLSQTYPPGSNNFSPPVQEAIRTAIWLADKSKSALTFMTSIDMPEGITDSQLTAEQPPTIAMSLVEAARNLLSQLVRDAQAKGIAATAEVACGKGWIEIILEVQKNKHDLVIVGTRNPSGIMQFLLGSTAQKLLRNCPCPVWVVRPDHTTKVSRIMVASDLQPVSVKALAVAAMLAPLAGAEIHFVHAVAYPFERVALANIDDDDKDRYRRQVQDDARRLLDEQVAKLGATAAGVKTVVVDGNRGADLAILRYIEQHQIDMLMMGTVARGGLPGILIGNTAEQLLHSVPCSLLAVKPDDFVCPL